MLLNHALNKPLVAGKARAGSSSRRSVSVKAVQAPKLVQTNSERIFQEAQSLLPGGVNSPVRAFRSVGGKPVVFDSVKGCKVTDVDGNAYIDYVGSWGPAICGHANDEVNAAIVAQLAKGASFGAPCELEVRVTSNDCRR